MGPAGSRITLRNAVALSYVVQGDPAGPVLVLVPGPTDSWHSYEPVLERLPLSIRAVAISQRGHGESDKPASGYRVEDYAGDLVELLDGLRVERAVLAGHSGSCPVVRRVALDHAERVAGLALEASPTTLRNHAGLEEFIRTNLRELADPIPPDFARSFVVGTSSAEVAAEVVDQMVREILQVPARVWRETFAGLVAYDDSSELGQISAPVLLQWGDADQVIGHAMQDELAARLRRPESVVYPGVGHTPRWEVPARFTADLAAFVQRVG